MAEPQIRDFQTTRARAATAQLLGNPEVRRLPASAGGDVEAQRHRRHSSASPSQRLAQGAAAASTSGLSAGRASIETLHRRPTRHNTVRQYSHSPSRPQTWEEPGAEPGIDTQREDAVLRFRHLQTECQITVVDFSEDRIEQHELDNRAFLDFLARPRPDWVACRWMNVNGISFDIIRALQKEKNLHRLAIEDLMQSRSRTKADWYSDHAFSEYEPVGVPLSASLDLC